MTQITDELRVEAIRCGLFTGTEKLRQRLGGLSILKKTIVFLDYEYQT